MAIRVNMEGVIAKIRTGNGARAIEKQVAPILKKEFNKKKKEVIQYFDNHPVTKELEGGADAPSNVVQTSHGGNLFSLLGFEDGEDPAGVVREKLENDIQATDVLIGTTKKKNTLLVSLRVTTPTISEISQEVQEELALEWTDRPWLEIIERGSSGFPQYLFRSLSEQNQKGKALKNSRSGTAIQVKNTLRSGSAKGVRYISDVLKKVRQIFRGGSE